MAKMKIEVMAAAVERHGLSLRDRAVAYLPRYAKYAATLAPLMNARDVVPGAAWAAERLVGLAADRPLPRWRRDAFLATELDGGNTTDGYRGEGGKGEVVLFADTFNTYFEPENVRAAAAVLTHLGYRVTALAAADRRPLCCGRTFLSAGLVDEARAEARRLLATAAPALERGATVVGLEPSCLLTLRDEFRGMLPGDSTDRLAEHSFLFEEFLAREAEAGRIAVPIARSKRKVLVHGHCHQKAFGAMGSVQKALGLVDQLDVETVESSCCGMAGAFGYGAETYEVSMRMGELSLLPAVRAAPEDTIVAADGFSCRHQIRDGTGREARHVARILHDLLSEAMDPSHWASGKAAVPG
jgi:Fe-S oxidoreductase